MRRADLAWALSAVIPHAGTATQGLNHVGLERRASWLYVYATDRYTSGIARIPDGIDVHNVALPVKEANDLMRFVRTDYVSEKEDDLAYALAPGELHIGFERQIDKHGNRKDDSAVFELTEPKVSLAYLLEYITRVNAIQPEWDELILAPKLCEKWAKATRSESDRLRIMPRHVSDRRGVAIVTVGSDFIGAISGLTYDQEGPSTVAEFLETEMEVAA